MSNRKMESLKSKARKVRAPDNGKLPETIGPNFRLIMLLAFAGTIGFALLTLLLLEGPGSPGHRQAGPVSGGESTVRKTAPAPTVEAPAPPAPEAKAAEAPPPQAAVAQAPDAGLAPAEQQIAVLQPPQPPPAGTAPELPSVAVVVPELPSGAETVPEQTPLPPSSSEDAAIISQATRPLPPKLDAGADAQQQSAPPPPLPVQRPEPALVAQPRAAPALPWQTDTGPPGQESVVANLPRQEPVRSVRLPSRSDVKSWVRSTAREFVGGVDADGLPLYRFDLWLDAPPEIRTQIRQVTYEYRAPSAQPPAQDSNEADTGFRVKFGAASCAERARITVIMIDGKERRVDVDGCRILN